MRRTTFRVLTRGALGAGVLAAAFAILAASTTTPLTPSGSATIPRSATTQPTTTVATPPPVAKPMLVLYDTTGEWATQGELDSIFSANLLGHFGPVTRLPIRSYTAGLMAGFAGVVYEGSTYDEPIPAEFLDDVAAGRSKVVWMGMNVWQLAARVAGGLGEHFGFEVGRLDPRPMRAVEYKNTSFTRPDDGESNPVGPIAVVDPARATTFGTMVAVDGSTLPWGVRAGALTYLAESPYSSMGERDRYVAWAAVLQDTFAPETPERHRALVRLEDIGPASDPQLLRRSIDELVLRRIPFTMAVYPLFMDPRGVQGPTYGADVTAPLRLDQRPELVQVIKYGLAHGGTIVNHGLTHQYGSIANPYDGVSAKDFEFYRARVDPDTDNVINVGPVREDSLEWATGRLTRARRLLDRAGIPLSKVTMFEFPHYAATPNGYQAVNDVYAGKNGDRPPTRYERGLYFPTLPNGELDYGYSAGQFFPYPVTDVYGALVVPENLGNVIEVGYNNNQPRSPKNIVETARRNLVVRDGVASFFYHAYLGPEQLAATLDGITGLGYEFVPATSIETYRTP